MSKDIEHIMREVMKSNKEIHNMDKDLCKDIVDLKKSVKNIETKIKGMDETLEKLLDILNTITVFIEEADEGELDLNDEDEAEDWTPYDERGFSYEEEYDEEDEWNNHEDES
jgi:seryl-tRNA synthetase